MMKFKFPSHLHPQPDPLSEESILLPLTLPGSIDALAGKAVELSSPL